MGDLHMEQGSFNLIWILLGRLVTLLMLPWMIWVSVSIVGLKTEVAVISSRVDVLPPAWFQAKVAGIEERVRILEVEKRTRP
jgi:hypothetical protein